ncbi:MAG: HAMP domain-containing sensor histidine kinase, partial [Chitinophagaceae bacterium]
LVLFSGSFTLMQLALYNHLSPGFLVVDSLNLPVALLGLYLNKQRLYTLAKLVSIIVNILIIIILKVYFYDSGVELVGLLGLIAAVFLFEEKWLIFSVSLFCIASYVALDTGYDTFSGHLVSLGLLHQLGTLGLVFLFLYSARSEMTRYHKGLVSQRQLIVAQNDRLNEANDLKTRLFSIVSHDLRSPMVAFELYLKEIQKNDLSPEELRSSFPHILKDVEGINILITNLLQWSQNQLTEQEVKCERLDVGRLIENNCRLFERQALSKNITLQACTDRNYLMAFGDKNITDTILRNLVSNAIKFSHSGKEVTISATLLQEEISIAVTDQGTGMSAIQVSDIINSKGSTTYGTAFEKGSGLGLLLSQQLLRKQGGKLNITSKPDEGTTISFELPKYKHE